MPNSESSSEIPISQEVETLFHLISPLLLEIVSYDSSLYRCTKDGFDVLDSAVAAFPLLPSESALPFSSAFVIFEGGFKNSKSQSMEKLRSEPFLEELNCASMAISATISEKHFEGDLPEGKGLESYILTAGEELVAIQSLALLREKSQPTLLSDKFRSPDQIPRNS